MRVGLLFVCGLAASALCALTVAADASATIVTTQYMSLAACNAGTGGVVNNGNPITNPNPATTGICTDSSGGSINRQWSSQYCSTAGDYIYKVYYSDSACSKAVQVKQTPTACSQSNYFNRPTCVSPANGPTQPTGDFPPSSWYLQTKYYNTTNSGTSTCVAGSDNIVTSITALKTGNCLARQASNGQSTAASTASYCASGLAGTVTFSDNSCGTVTSAELNQIGCFGNTQTSCPSGAAAFPKLPITGKTLYQTTDCTATPTYATTYNYGTESCFDSSSASCTTVNGVPSIVSENWYDPAKLGACTTYQSNSTYAVDTCITTAFSSQSSKYSCNMAQVGAASAASSASMLAIAFAAIVAMLASRVQ